MPWFLLFLKLAYSTIYWIQFSSVQLLSHVRLFATPWISTLQASLSITNSWTLLKLMSIESMMPYSHLILCHPLLLLPPISPSIRDFSNVSTLRMRWTKYWSFSFNISPSKERSGLISFRMDWLDLLAVQGTLKSLLQHHSSDYRYSNTILVTQFKKNIPLQPKETQILYKVSFSKFSTLGKAVGEYGSTQGTVMKERLLLRTQE